MIHRADPRYKKGARTLLSRYRTVEERVFYFMRNFEPWTFWDLQSSIRSTFGEFYGEPTISAAIRELRRSSSRKKFDFPSDGEVVEKERLQEGKGYRYQLSRSVLESWSN
jgi:hypothetical protein